VDHELIIRVEYHQPGMQEVVEPKVTVLRRRALLNGLADAGWSEPELESLDARLDMSDDIELGNGITLHKRWLSAIGRNKNSTKNAKKNPSRT
jgi:hypothetical protein